MAATIPPLLRAGDKIRVVASASRLPVQNLNEATAILKSWGLIVEVDPQVYLKDGMFAGSDSQRLQAVQKAIDDENVSAVFFARGGYGSLRILEQLDFGKLLSHPKWLVGFSDVCTFHLALNNVHGLASLHGSMPIQYASLGSFHESIGSIRDFLFTGEYNKSFLPHPDNQNGIVEAEVTGGNLAIINSLLYNQVYLDFDNKILFIEEIGEYHYTIDRMLLSLKHAGVLDQLAGVLVGDFSNMKESALPFEKNIGELIRRYFSGIAIPIAFGLPMGHEERNICLPFGVPMQLKVNAEGVFLDRLNLA